MKPSQTMSNKTTQAGEHGTVQMRVGHGDGAKISYNRLREMCLAAGADDVGIVEIDRAGLEEERDGALAAFPRSKVFVSYVCRVGRENMRTPMRSVSNLEFHHVADKVNEVGRELVHALEREGIGAINPAHGFPMEADNWPGRLWVVSHKPIAEAAGMGVMGIHRIVIHPNFGNHILLGTVVIDAEVEYEDSERDEPLDFNPCLECKLCVAACPTGAVKPNGDFDFAACYTHNYREFMGGFGDWVEGIASSKNAKEYRSKYSDTETVSMWQSLGFGPNYKAAYCMAVCPAGEDVIGPFLENKKQYVADVVKPLQKKDETIYVIEGSDAQQYVATRYRNKKIKAVGSGLRPNSAAGFFSALPLLFQREQSRGLDCVYHFTIENKVKGQGKDTHKATITIRDQKLEVKDGLHGKATIRLIASEAAWIGFVRKERSLVRGLLTFGIKIKGNPKLMLRFGQCFPS